VATPANWKDGDDVIIVPSLQDPEVIKQKFPKGYKAVKPYLTPRVTPPAEEEQVLSARHFEAFFELLSLDSLFRHAWFSEGERARYHALRLWLSWCALHPSARVR
jgi:hypothetical protein